MLFTLLYLSTEMVVYSTHKYRITATVNTAQRPANIVSFCPRHLSLLSKGRFARIRREKTERSERLCLLFDMVPARGKGWHPFLLKTRLGNGLGRDMDSLGHIRPSDFTHERSPTSIKVSQSSGNGDKMGLFAFPFFKGQL